MPLISVFPAGDVCSSPTCRALLQSLLDKTTQVLRVLDNISERHEKREVQTELRLDAVNTLKDGYIAFNRRLEDQDIEVISQRAGILYNIPGNHTGDSNPSGTDGKNRNSGDDASGSEYTDLSSTGLSLQ